MTNIGTWSKEPEGYVFVLPDREDVSPIRERQIIEEVMAQHGGRFPFLRSIDDPFLMNIKVGTRVRVLGPQGEDVFDGMIADEDGMWLYASPFVYPAKGS